MVDYSKWDKMQFDSDDEEQDATRMDQKMYQDFSGIGRTVTGKSGVKVTKLDSTSSVTFGGGNRGKVVADVDKLKSSATTATPQGRKTEKTVVFDSDFKTWTRNGALHGEQYAWSQTRNEVDVYIFVPSHIKGKDLDVQVLEKSLKITLKNDAAIDTPVVLTSPKDEERSNRSVVIDEEFAYTVVQPEDVYDTEWELVEAPHDPKKRKAVLIHLKKKPIPGGISVILWWSKCFEAEKTEIDVSKIPERVKYADSQKAWLEAHEMFRNKTR